MVISMTVSCRMVGGPYEGSILGAKALFENFNVNGVQLGLTACPSKTIKVKI